MDKILLAIVLLVFLTGCGETKIEFTPAQLEDIIYEERNEAYSWGYFDGKKKGKSECKN